MVLDEYALHKTSIFEQSYQNYLCNGHCVMLKEQFERAKQHNFTEQIF